MKKVSVILIGIVALFSCTKEVVNVVNSPENTVEQNDVYELFAKVDDMTKAAIDEANGAFTWTVGNDEIAVKTSANKVYKYKAVEIINDIARFTCTDDVDGTPETAVYPYTDAATCTLPTEVNLTSALTSGIRLTGTIDGKNITFQHANALLKVSFTNVPTFASFIFFDGDNNDVTVNGISLTERREVSAYIPVDPSTKAFTVSLKDNAGNVILEKSTSGKSFTAGSLMKMSALNVDGTVFVFNDNGNVDEARFFKTDGGNVDYSTSSYIGLNVLSDGCTKWCILPTTNTWSKIGNPVCLQVFKAGSYVSSTEAIWLYRDFSFDTTEGSLKTNFRIYVYMSDAQWTHWQTQGEGTNVVKFTTWGGLSTPDTNAVMERNADDNGFVVYHEFSSDNYGKSSVKYRFYNEHNAGWESKNESGITLNRDIWGANL